MRQKKTRKARKKDPYSTGEKNLIVDAILHPFFKRNQLVRIVDGIAHFIIEDNTKSSVKKFVKYNWREIVKELMKKM